MAALFGLDTRCTTPSMQRLRSTRHALLIVPALSCLCACSLCRAAHAHVQVEERGDGGVSAGDSRSDGFSHSQKLRPDCSNLRACSPLLIPPPLSLGLLLLASCSWLHAHPQPGSKAACLQTPALASNISEQSSVALSPSFSCPLEAFLLLPPPPALSSNVQNVYVWLYATVALYSRQTFSR